MRFELSLSLIFRISELIKSRSSKRTLRWLETFWQRIKRWWMSYASRKQRHNGFNVSWKSCLNLCSLRWLKPTLRLVNNFNLETSLFPKVVFAVGRINSLKVLCEILNMKDLDRLRNQIFPFSSCLRQKWITRSFCYAENLSNFEIVTCIIMPIWWGK